MALIDFQWCGFGLAATDVAHHIAAALAPECVSADGTREAQLLDHYHAKLCDSLAAFGAAADADHAACAVFTRAQLQEQYESALLDMCRLVLAYQWSRASFGVAALNRNSYNKDARSAAWLAARASRRACRRAPRRSPQADHAARAGAAAACLIGGAAAASRAATSRGRAPGCAQRAPRAS